MHPTDDRSFSLICLQQMVAPRSTLWLLAVVFCCSYTSAAESLSTPADRDGYAALASLVGAPLSDEAIGRIEAISTRKPLYRRLPTQKVRCQPELLVFLLKYPDVVVALWERLGATELSLSELVDDDMPWQVCYTLTETTGTRGIVEPLYFSARDGIALVGIRGTYRGPFVAKEIPGESLLLFRWSSEDNKQTTDARPIVTCRLDTFVSIHHPGADALARLLSPVVGKIADENFEQTMLFIESLSGILQTEAETMVQIVYRLTQVRREVRREFGSVARSLEDNNENSDAWTHARVAEGNAL